MVKISEIVNQNPWWKHGEKFVVFDKNLKEAKEKPIFFKRKRIEVSSKDIWKVPQVKECAILTKEDLRTEDNVILAPVDMTMAVLEKSHRAL